MLWIALGTVAGLYMLLVAAVYFLQARLIYLPMRVVDATPDDRGFTYEPVSFEATDGVKLAGWFVPAQEARGVVLFCHGNAGNISDRLDTIEILHRLRVSTFIFDYRGYGDSEGRPTEEGTYADADGAWRYLVEGRKVPPSQIVLFGRSLGGAIAAWLARAHTPRALVLESTFTSMPDIGRKFYPFLPIELISRFDYSTKDYIKQVKCPVLVIHSPDDDLIPYSQGRRLFELAPEPKEFLRISGTHNEGFMTAGQLYLEGLNRFLTKVLEK